MTIKKIIMASAAAATLFVAGATGAAARPWVDHDHDGRPAGSYAERHDSAKDWYRNHGYAHPEARGHTYRRIVAHDRVYSTVRSHHYRYVGAPYWYRGHYGVRAYDPYGKIVFVGVDPYSGAWGGVTFRF